MSSSTQRIGMLLDTSKCMGCRGCQVACKQWNQLRAEKTEFTGTYQNPPRLSGQTWTLITFNEIEGTEPQPVKWLFRKEQCHHCGEATCLQVCPTGAIRKTDEGIVYIDQAVCAGCKYCVETCPFQVPHADHTTGTARKCWMCMDRVQNGMKPACATACTTGAIEFGPWETMAETARKRVEALKAEGIAAASVYGDQDMLGGLGAMYVLTESPAAYGLPDKPTLPHAKIAWKWLLGLVPGLFLLAAMFKGLRKKEAAEANA